MTFFVVTVFVVSFKYPIPKSAVNKRGSHLQKTIYKISLARGQTPDFQCHI